MVKRRQMRSTVITTVLRLAFKDAENVDPSESAQSNVDNPELGRDVGEINSLHW